MNRLGYRTEFYIGLAAAGYRTEFHANAVLCIMLEPFALLSSVSLSCISHAHYSVNGFNRFRSNQMPQKGFYVISASTALNETVGRVGPLDLTHTPHQWWPVTAPNGDRGWRCERCGLTAVRLTKQMWEAACDAPHARHLTMAPSAIRN